MKPLVVYQTARALAGDPLEGSALQALQEVDTAVQVTRMMLDHGRANVTTDIRDTDHESSRRKIASSEMIGNLNAQRGGHRSPIDDAAAALAAKAGVCDDFGVVATHMYADLQPVGKQSTLVGSQAIQHTWAEVRPEAKSGESTRTTENTIIMDPWAQGPAIEAKDANLGYEKEPKQDMMTIKHADAANAHAALVGRIPDFGIGAQAHIEQRVAELGIRGETWVSGGGKTYEPMNVMGDALAQQAKAAMGTQGPTLKDNLAAVAAQRTAGASVAGAVAGAPDVLAAVKQLPHMENPPPLTNPRPPGTPDPAA